MANLPTSLDHCVIHVSDWEVSRAFYTHVIGAVAVPGPKGSYAFRLGDQQVNVHGPGETGNPVARLPVMPGNSDLCFRWEGDINAAADHLAEHGVTVELGPVKRRGARGEGMSVYFRDPDGSLMEFISYG
jgi:catechol 2,3-dioxygenase-like lactoylglutathione lyase family enzyme